MSNRKALTPEQKISIVREHYSMAFPCPLLSTSTRFTPSHSINGKDFSLKEELLSLSENQTVISSSGKSRPKIKRSNNSEPRLNRRMTRWRNYEQCIKSHGRNAAQHSTHL